MDTEEHPLLRSIVAWAASRSDVRAVRLTASRSAEAGTGDAVSDFDVDLFVDEPAALGGEGWLEAIAPVLVASEDDEGEDPVRLVFFEAQQKVEFRVRPAAAGDGPAPAGGSRELYARVPGTHAPAPGDGGPASEDGVPDVGDVRGPSPCATRRAALLAAVPVLSTPDVPACLAHLDALGFAVRSDGPGGDAVRDGVRLRVVPDPAGGPAARGLVELETDDPETLAREWAALPVGRTTRLAHGDGSWIHVDPVGNVLRLGRPRTT